MHEKTLFYLYEFTDDISGVCMKKHCFTSTNSQVRSQLCAYIYTNSPVLVHRCYNT